MVRYPMVIVGLFVMVYGILRQNVLTLAFGMFVIAMSGFHEKSN